MKKIQLILFSCLLFAACGKVDQEPGPQGPAGPQGPVAVRPADDTATIYGNASLYDELTFKYPTFDSIKVTLQWGKDTLQTTTDTAGNYAFPHRETGTYNLTFERPGFGTMKVYSVTHTGGGKLNTQVPAIAMIQKPNLTQARNIIPRIEINQYATFFILLLDLGFNANDYQFAFENNGNYEVYLSNKPNPGPINYVLSTTSIQLRSDISTAGFTYGVAYDFGTMDKYFHTGDTVYAAITTFTRYGFTPVPGIPGYGTWSLLPVQKMTYIDPKTGQTVWPAKGTPVYGKGVYRKLPAAASGQSSLGLLRN